MILGINKEGIIVLGVRRPDAGYYGAATGETRIRAGDTLTCYGPDERLRQLSTRPQGPEGDNQHRRAVEQQLAALEQQRQRMQRQ